MAKKDTKTGKRMSAAQEVASIEVEAAEKSTGQKTAKVYGNTRKFTAVEGRQAVMVAVQFNQSYGAYNADERAGFGEAKAKELVDAGVARLAGSAKYNRPQTKKQIESTSISAKREAAAESRKSEKAAKAEAKANKNDG